MIYAVKRGHTDLVKFFVSNGADHLNLGMECAARRGNWELIEFFFSKGADNWYPSAWAACQDNHFDLVEFFRSKEANGSTHKLAAKQGHSKMINLLLPTIILGSLFLIVRKLRN